MTWLDASELRVGLGCMRLTAGEEVVASAARAGITVFDTAHAYGREPGDNERMLARALRESSAEQSARIVTKGGMARPGGAWVTDGRARVIRADCEASLNALDGLPIDLYLLHAPDPRVPWRTSVRALARLLEEGMVGRIGLSNVNRRQLDEALSLAPITAVEVALSLFDDRAIRGGVVERCDELGIAVIAHSPLGGPRRTGRLARREPLASIAAARTASAAGVALAWLLGLSPNVVAIPGARRTETSQSAARAATLVLTDVERLAVQRAFAAGRPAPRSAAPGASPDADVVLVMGIPGAGKTRLAERLVARGYVRLNRDERGGALRDLAGALDAELSAGTRRAVLDNSYLTRAARSYTVEAASRHGIPVRCMWLDIPLAQAQVNLVQRLLDRAGALPTPEQLRALARREPGMLAPTSQMRTLRELEPPSLDEGFASVERVEFERVAAPEAGGPGVFVAAATLRGSGWERALENAGPSEPHLIFDWHPAGVPESLDPLVALLGRVVAGTVERALCPHPGGPPRCWCRPPLPGLVLEFARRNGVDPARSTLIGSGPAHRTLAAALGARYVPV